MSTVYIDDSLPKCKIHSYIDEFSPNKTKLPEPCGLICLSCLLGKTTPENPIEG
jgi:hypothetical protein